nr:MAG TPA: hypothetical protein [Caudoviricetes sp.]
MFLSTLLYYHTRLKCQAFFQNAFVFAFSLQDIQYSRVFRSIIVSRASSLPLLTR